MLSAFSQNPSEAKMQTNAKLYSSLIFEGECLVPAICLARGAIPIYEWLEWLNGCYGSSG